MKTGPDSQVTYPVGTVEALGLLLTDIRRSLDMTQREAAKAAGISERTLRDAERGTRALSSRSRAGLRDERQPALLQGGRSFIGTASRDAIVTISVGNHTALYVPHGIGRGLLSYLLICLSHFLIQVLRFGFCELVRPLRQLTV